jgi:hypothetical protein
MRTVLACSFILINFTTFSQIQTEVLDPKAILKVQLHKDTSDLALRINLCKLTILDSRDDTSSIGYSPNLEVKKYIFRSGFQNELRAWLTGYLLIDEKYKTGTTLLVNIKKLRNSQNIRKWTCWPGKERIGKRDHTQNRIFPAKG